MGDGSVAPQNRAVKVSLGSFLRKREGEGEEKKKRRERVWLQMAGGMGQSTQNFGKVAFVLGQSKREELKQAQWTTAPAPFSLVSLSTGSL